MVHLMLNYLCCPACVFAMFLFEILVEIIHFNLFIILFTAIRENADIDLFLSAELVHSVTANCELFLDYCADWPCLEVVSDNGLFVPAEDGTSASLNFKNAGGEVVVSVSTNMENWTYDISDDSWLDVTADKHYITVSAGQNESTESRKSAITVTASDNNDNSINYVINVSQNYAGQPEITVGSNAVRFPAYGELSSEVVVETNQDDLDFDCTCQWPLVEKTDNGLKLTG